MNEYIDILKHYCALASLDPKFPLHLCAGYDISSATIYKHHYWIYYDEEKQYIHGHEHFLKRLYIRKLSLQDDHILHDHHHDLTFGGWILNEEMSLCMICHAEFHHMFKHKHHCRGCGNLVCSSCSPNYEVIYQFEHLGPQRVCVQCYWGQSPVHLIQRHNLSSPYNDEISSLSPLPSSYHAITPSSASSASAKTPSSSSSSSPVKTPSSSSSSSAADKTLSVTHHINFDDTSTPGLDTPKASGASSWKNRRMSVKMMQAQHPHSSNLMNHHDYHHNNDDDHHHQQEFKIELHDDDHHHDDLIRDDDHIHDRIYNDHHKTDVDVHHHHQDDVDKPTLIDPTIINDVIKSKAGGYRVDDDDTYDDDGIDMMNRRSLEDMQGISPRAMSSPSSAVWKKFLAKGEILIASSQVMKKSPFGVMQARQLLLTDAPALIYADIRNKEYKGEIPWDERQPPVVNMIDSVTFEVVVEGRIYQFIDHNNGAKYWVDHISRTARQYMIY